MTTVASMAPTCVAAININGAAIHTALSIPKGFDWPSVSFSLATFLSINLISSFCTQFQLFPLNFNFLHCLGLIDMLSANQHGEIFSCILLANEFSNPE